MIVGQIKRNFFTFNIWKENLIITAKYKERKQFWKGETKIRFIYAYRHDKIVSKHKDSNAIRAENVYTIIHKFTHGKLFFFFHLWCMCLCAHLCSLVQSKRLDWFGSMWQHWIRLNTANVTGFLKILKTSYTTDPVGPLLEIRWEKTHKKISYEFK